MKNKTTVKMTKKFIVLFTLFLLTTLPVAFAVSVNPDSIVVDVTATSATVTWETDTAATGALNYGTSTSSLTQTPSTAGEAITHEATAADLEEGQRYYYNIEATDDDGTYTSTYMEFTTLLEAPENVEATLEENIVTLGWDDVDDATLYYIFKDGSYLDVISTEVYTTSELSYSTTYFFYVTAVDDQGRQSATSESIEVILPEEPVDITFIQTTPITKNTATISWETDRDANSTILYGTAESNLNYSITDADQTTEHELVLKALDEDTTYYFDVISGPTTYETTEFFRTLGDDAVIVIDNIAVSDITRSSAEISWTTNVEDRGYIYYSVDDTFSQYVREDTDEVTHQEEVDELLSGTTYYFKIIADETVSEIQSFTTSESLYDFIDMEEVPALWNDDKLNLKGTTAEDAKVYIFVNKDSNPYAQITMDINGTYFEANITLNPYNYIDGIKGRNEIEINSWDTDNNKAIATFIVDVDTAAPALSVNDFSTWTNEDELNITGYTDADTTVTFYIDDKKKTSVYVSDEEGYFEVIVDVGTATKSHNLTVEAMDAAGNTATWEKEFHVDRQDPKLTFFTSFTESTHYKLFRVDGETEPNAMIKVTNFGEYSGCDDVNFQTKYGNCDYLASMYGNGPHQTLDMLLDPTSLMLDLLDVGIGVPTTTVADEHGNFSIIVSLQAASTNTDWATTSSSSVHDASIKAAKNTLVFNVTDNAGNKYDTKKQIKYQPSCADWQIATTTTFPMNIYTQDLTGGDIMGSALFEIRYMGAGTPEVAKITVQEDASGGQQLIKEGEVEMGTAQSIYYKQSYGGLENSNEYVSIYSQEIKHTEYDNGHVYLYAPVNINKYVGNVEELPEQFGVYLDAYISYTDGYGNVASCHLYPAVAYDVQKPESVSKWLSPTMINDTINFLDDTINITESAVHYLGIASRWTLVSCGGMIAWNYAKGFSGSSLNENQCNEDLEKVYAVCDRILCPPIGRNCKAFEPIGDLYYGGGSCDASDADCRQNYESAKIQNGEIEGALASEYAEHKDLHEDHSFTDFYTKTQTEAHQAAIAAADPKGTYDTTISGSYQYQVTDPSTGELVKVAYYDKDDQLRSDTKAWDKYNVDDCHDPNNVETIIVYTGLDEKEKAGWGIGGATAIEGKTVECSDKTKEELGDPKTNEIPGCFSDECPAYDNTKCLFGKGYGKNPASGLFASLQCGCLTGAKGHLENYLKILIGAKKCFQQVLLGDQTAGYCERLMSYFVCDILTEIFKNMFQSLSQGVGPIAGLYGEEQVQNYQENAQSISKGLSDRYGDIVKDNAAFSTDNLINKACLAAFTADWSVLEGVLDTIVDNVYVEPIATVSGSSRPYGFDPFTGRITMAYNVYVGIFPGGPTQVEAWLECEEGPGSFCAAGDTSKIDLVQQGKVHPYMDQDDYFDENIVVFDNNGMSVYNKVTLVLTYEVGGVQKKRIIEAELYPKGDITALGCSFSTSVGFECSLGLEFMDLAHGVGGTVQLYSDQQGSTLSPDITQYYLNNQVAALVKVQNAYPDAFYLRVTGTTDAFEYRELGGTQTGDYYGLQYYLLWLESSGSASSGTKSLSHVETEVTIVHADEPEGLWFSLPVDSDGNEILSEVELKLSPVEEEGENEMYMVAVRCEIEKGETTSMETNGRTYYKCLGPDDEENYVRSGTTTERTYEDIEYIKGIKFSNLKEAADPLNVGDTLRFYMLNAAHEGNDYIEATYTSTSTSSTKSRTSEINVLADTNDDNMGETKIYSADQDPKDQEFTLSYSIGETPSSTAQSRPVVHFIEPTPLIESNVAYVNSDYSPVPIGFTLWDDDNAIDTISIGVVGSNPGNTYQCLVTWDFDEASNSVTNPSATSVAGVSNCGVTPTNRFIGFQEGMPPFFEFNLEVDRQYVKIDNDAFYDITIHVVDEDGNKGEDRIRRIRFAVGSELTYDDMLVCLGSGACSKWEPASDDVQAIASGSAQAVAEEKSTSSLDSSEPELQGLSP